MVQETKLDDIQQKIQALYDSQTSVESFFSQILDLASRFTRADSCSLYLCDSTEEVLLLKATGGPTPETAAPVRVARSEGILGTAVSQARTIRASSAGTGYRSQMVVPIRRGPRTLGAVVLKHRRPDFFSETTAQDIRILFAQLGATIQDTSYLAPFQRQETRLSPDSAYAIHGQTASRGTATGFALPWETGFGDESEDPTEDATPEEARIRFEASLEITRRQLELIRRDSESDLYDVSSLIFGAHLLMLTDDAFSGEMKRLIAEGSRPAAAVRQVVNQYADALSAIPDTRMAEKAQDVRDLGHRLIQNLVDPSADSFDYRNAIVIAHSIYPSELVSLVAQEVAGIVFSGSGVTSHIAILSRSLSVPVLITQDPRLFQIVEKTPLLLDASGGSLQVNPANMRSEKNGTRGGDSPLRNRSDNGKRGRAARREDSPAVDPEWASAAEKKHAVKILANVNLFSDTQLALRNHAEGLGLYRSEFPFIIRNDFLSEGEQLFIYRRIIESFSGSEITFRTADIGGDKLFENTGPREQNPFLGVRGIRFSLANREMFRDQLRAMLRAGVNEDLRIMFPMVSSVDEIMEAREEVERSITALRNDGLPHNENPKIGAMVELPSAVEAIDEFADATDFLSIGTNDLVMYLLAVDRTNERLSQLYRSYHPIVLRVLRRIVDGVGEKRNELSVCGDSAGDPLMIPFYLGIGIRKLSIHPAELPQIYTTLSDLSPHRTRIISQEMLSIRRISEMERYLKSVQVKSGLHI